MTKRILPRALVPGERALLDFLLSSEFPGCEQLKAQIDNLQVTGVCECGCGTVNFSIKGQAARAVCREPIPVEAQGDGIDVLLFVRNGLLSSLEIVMYRNIRSLPYPQPSDLIVWVTPPQKLHRS